MRIKEQILPRIEDWGRFIGFLIFFLVGLTIIISGWRGEIPLFYQQAYGDVNDWIRILWCIALSFIGFSFAAYHASKSSHGSSGAAWKLYTTIYPVGLISLSVSVFAFLHI